MHLGGRGVYKSQIAALSSHRVCSTQNQREKVPLRSILNRYRLCGARSGWSLYGISFHANERVFVVFHKSIAVQTQRREKFQGNCHFLDRHVSSAAFWCDARGVVVVNRAFSSHGQGTTFRRPMKNGNANSLPTPALHIHTA